MKTRAERRKNDYNKAIRKKNIAEHNHGSSWYDNLHQYSKNKIHCSCPLCRGEVWSVGQNSVKQLTITDQKKMNSMEFQMNEINAEE